MRRKPHNDLCMQRTLSTHRKQFANQTRHQQRQKCRNQRRPNRYGSDDRSVRCDTSAELYGKKHRRASDQRCGQQQKRKRSETHTGSGEQRKRQQEESRKLQIRRLQDRQIKHRDERVNRAEHRHACRRQHPDTNAHPCRCKAIHTAVHQQIVEEKLLDYDFHATSITITVISSEPPFARASFRSRSPGLLPIGCSSRIACSVPSGSASCTPSEQSTIRSFRLSFI